MVNKELLKILRCPESRAILVEEGDFLISTDPVSRRKYSVIKGIPVLLIDQSEILSEENWRKIMEKHSVDIPPAKGKR